MPAPVDGPCSHGPMPAPWQMQAQALQAVTAHPQEHDSRQTGMRLLERSVWSDRMVFVRAVRDAEWMSDLELKLYDSWWVPATAVTRAPACTPCEGCLPAWSRVQGLACLQTLRAPSFGMVHMLETAASPCKAGWLAAHAPDALSAALPPHWVRCEQACAILAAGPRLCPCLPNQNLCCACPGLHAAMPTPALPQRLLTGQPRQPAADPFRDLPAPHRAPRPHWGNLSARAHGLFHAQAEISDQ